ESSADLSTEEELRLEQILSLIRGVGEVDVMITYMEPDASRSVFSAEDTGETRQVRGVIAAAEGADSPVVRQEITDAVTSVFHIPTSSVMVFQRESRTGF
ncbi:MAG: hypothetical protein IJO79_02950, partial [Firmicutes bacterium]|nr:hypothetical protein [Bacillota bacterium]